jgi:hypothetical protein
LKFLKIHYASPYNHAESNGYKWFLTACGRMGPNWARKSTADEDFVTCEACLKVLVQEALRAVAEREMSTSEILDRRG